jgi:hypothetical protein
VMPDAADIPAPIAESVRFGRFLSVQRNAGVAADHALVVHQAMAGHPAASGDVCFEHAARGVDVWRMPEPGGDRPYGTIDGSVAVAHHIAHSSALPVFVHGSSHAAAMTYRALQASTFFNGAILVVDALGAHDLTLSPAQGGVTAAIPLSQNTKPILYIVAEPDQAVADTIAKTVLRTTGGPVEVHREPIGIDRMMRDHRPAHSDIVLEWCLRQLSNHLTPAWRKT